MLRIQRSSNGEVVFKLSGRIHAGNLGELTTVLQSEARGCHIVLDLGDLTLVDREAVRFLALCEADSIKLKNCPAYISEWIVRERNAGDLH
jgi:anti-anti-sigma regulatory factor